MIKPFCAWTSLLLLTGCAVSPGGATFESQPLPSSYLQPLAASSQYDTPPKLVRGWAPFYPPGYAIKRKQGTVVVEFNVRVDGSINEIRVVSSTTPAFTRQALAALQKWRFAPALKHGQPVEVRVRVPFNFRA